ncbi:MAG: sugar transferase [Vampirovibrionales bacterium]|nr:sugar transferase [Vampirovibrionales bacterium]
MATVQAGFDAALLASLRLKEQAPQIPDVPPPPYLTFYERAFSLPYKLEQRMKRAFDFAAAAFGLLLVSPLLAFISIAIALTSPGPVIYRSIRIGKNSEPFYMYKFRTMAPDADQRREALRQAASLEGQLFKLADDPRVTPIGRLLRATSLDELPQLVNVLLGDMSLVGPRPLPLDESMMFEAPYTLRFQVLPGVTGLWQVSGRSNLSFLQLCELELQYALNWSLWQDFSILLKTIPTVLFKRGAC